MQYCKHPAHPLAPIHLSTSYEVLQLLATPDGSYVATLTTRVSAYLENVGRRFTSGNQQTFEGYKIIAEGRLLYKAREDARPNGGLNEFQLTRQNRILCPLARWQRGEVEFMSSDEVKVFLDKAKEKGYSGFCPMYSDRAAEGLWICCLLLYCKFSATQLTCRVSYMPKFDFICWREVGLSRVGRKRMREGQM